MQKLSAREPTARQREWLEHLKSCREQGLSLKAYAEQRGIAVQRFYHWHRRLKLLGFIAGAEAVSFATVQVERSGVLTGSQRLHFPNGLVLEWEAGADLGLIERLLHLSRTVR